MMTEDDARQEEGLDRLFSDYRDEIIEESARSYLYEYGDYILERIHATYDSGQKLLSAGFFQQSQTTFVTGIDIALKFLIIRPVLIAPILEDEWIELIVQRILPKSSVLDTGLLKKILSLVKIDISRITIGDEELLSTLGRVIKARHLITHAYSDCNENASLEARETLLAILKMLVVPMARHYSFKTNLEESDPFKLRFNNGSHEVTRDYDEFLPVSVVAHENSDE